MHVNRVRRLDGSHNHIVLMNIGHQDPASRASIDPEPGLLAALACMQEPLILQQSDHFLPIRVPASNKGLRDQQMQMSLLEVETVKADVITKEVIRQQMVH